MSVLNETAGITTEHIGAIERVCREMNTFLLVRPSTKETMQLIGEGIGIRDAFVRLPTQEIANHPLQQRRNVRWKREHELLLIEGEFPKDRGLR